jgi:hypothetical protein
MFNLAYVIYRVAASMVLVLSLSIVIFVTGCTCGSLYIIILALLNDISMIPVAYDNAKATTKPQLPKGKCLSRLSTSGQFPNHNSFQVLQWPSIISARSLVLQSGFYGIVNAFLTIMVSSTLNAKDL